MRGRVPHGTKEDRRMERKMRTISGFLKLGLPAVMVVAMLCGCGTVDISDEGAYDKYYAVSVSKLTAAPSPKFVFYVPYKKFKISSYAIADTTPVLKALKDVYGKNIAFEKSSSAPCVVSVKSVEEWKEGGFKAEARIIADFTSEGETKELVANYSRMGEWSLDVDHVYELYRAVAFELAQQIKNRTDAQP